MIIRHQNNSPRYQRDGITSYLIVSEKTCGAKNLAITIVEMEPGGFQHLHSHKPEQMYYILEGHGVMNVDGKEQTVQAGNCIFFPPSTVHGLKNTGEGMLRYISAASPSFTLDQCERWWQLEPVGIDP